MSSWSQIPHPSIPWAPLLYFLFLWICLLCPFYINEIMQYMAFCVWLISSSIMLSRFIPVTCFPFYGSIIFHCMYISYFVYPLICWWTFGLFPLWGFMNNAFMNMYVQIFVWIYVFNFLGYLRMALMSDKVTICLTFWGTAKLFSTVTAPFSIPTSNIWRFQFLHSFVNTCYFQFLWF